MRAHRVTVLVTSAALATFAGAAASFAPSADGQLPVVAPVSTLIATGSPPSSSELNQPKPPPIDQQTDAALQVSAIRLKQLDALRAATAAEPSRYGGVATNGDADVMLCDNGASAADPTTDRLVSELRATGSKVTVQPCRHTLAELNAVLAQVPESTVFTANGVSLKRWGLDYGANAVEIGVDTIPSGFADKVAALWGSAAYLMVPRSAKLQTGSRTDDFAPFFGGDVITAGGYECTSGFTMYNY